MHLLSPHAYSREYRWRRWVAILAAYALALQAPLGQLSASVHASTGRADAGRLCAPDQGQAPGPIPNPASPRAEFCCALACHPSGTDCAVESLPACLPFDERLEARLDSLRAFHIAAASVLPLGARAPPVAS
jgi:hypothetical protein